MNLQTQFQFPTVTDAQMALGHGRTNPALLAEAKARGFYNGHTPYNDMFNTLFFKGGRLNFKNDIDAQYKDKVLRYLTAFIRSFDPKHEEKEAVCALLLSEVCEA